MPHQFEPGAEQVGIDLSRRDMESAATHLREELHRHPGQAIEIMHLANRIARQNGSPDHVTTEDPSGRVTIRDDQRHTQIYVSNIYEEQRHHDGQISQSDENFSTSNYPDSRYPDSGQPYPMTDRSFNSPICPPGTHPAYAYNPSLPIPDCYGNNSEQRGLDPAAAALLLLGGVAVGRSISNSSEHYSVRHHR